MSSRRAEATADAPPECDELGALPPLGGHGAPFGETRGETGDACSRWGSSAIRRRRYTILPSHRGHSDGDKRARHRQSTAHAASNTTTLPATPATARIDKLTPSEPAEIAEARPMGGAGTSSIAGGDVGRGVEVGGVNCHSVGGSDGSGCRGGSEGSGGECGGECGGVRGGGNVGGGGEGARTKALRTVGAAGISARLSPMNWPLGALAVSALDSEATTAFAINMLDVRTMAVTATDPTDTVR